MAGRTQHKGKTERTKESHGQCSQPPSIRLLKTADLGTQALLVVNSFKLHLTAFNLHVKGQKKILDHCTLQNGQDSHLKVCHMQKTTEKGPQPALGTDPKPKSSSWLPGKIKHCCGHV